VQVSVEKPEWVDPNISLFVRLHSAADGCAKYTPGWNRPQTLGLLADDIITVSFFSARTEGDFDKLNCEEFAEVYLPWVEIRYHIEEGRISFYDLAIRMEEPWLGPTATPAQYRHAFARAYHSAKKLPTQPRIRVGISLLPRHDWDQEEIGETALISAALKSARTLLGPVKETPANAVSSPAVVCSMTELTPEEEAHITMLQKQNEDLRLLLGMQDAEDGPAVQDKVQEHLEAMRREVSDNYALRADMQAADKELAILHARLYKEQHMAISEEAGEGGPAGSGDSLQSEVHLKRVCAEVFDETYRVCRANVELITHYEQVFKALEGELVASRQTQGTAAQDVGSSLSPEERYKRVAFRLQRQEEELGLLEGECRRLHDAITHETEGCEEERSATMQQLMVEHEVQNDEMGRLQQMLQQQQVSVPPMTGQLRDQVATLEAELQQAQQRCTQQRQAAEQHAEWLRRETLDLQQQLQVSTEDQEVAAAELELQRAEPGTASAVGHAVMEREQLDGELSRLRYTIEVFDEKIKKLNENAADIRERASQVLSAVPERTGSHDPDVLRLEELEMAVNEQQYQMEVIRIHEAKLEEEHDKAIRALEAAKVESGQLESAMERKTLLMRARTRMAQSRGMLQSQSFSP